MARLPYKWQIEFESGKVFTQPDNFVNSRDLPDHQLPPIELGNPVRITALPTEKKYKRIDVNIPKGGLPVFTRRMVQHSNNFRAKIKYYYIGYNIDGHRFISIVNPIVGIIDFIEDDLGFKVNV